MEIKEYIISSNIEDHIDYFGQNLTVIGYDELHDMLILTDDMGIQFTASEDELKEVNND